jgi:hydroxypyruvate isomerase
VTVRLAANLSILFPRLPFLERFGAAARAGFDAVEFWWPSREFSAGMAEEAVVAAARGANTFVIMMNFDGGDLPSGDRGLAADPARVDAFRENVPRALELAQRLGCRKLNALAGRATPDVPLDRQEGLLAESISFAAGQAAAFGATILLEPLNLVESPGYLIPDVPSALDMIQRVGHPNVRVQLDVYHIAMGGADPVAMIRHAAGRIGHVQFADVPGRHEPGTGRLNFADIVTALGEAGYDDTLGLEYVPTLPEAPDFTFLAWLRRLVPMDTPRLHQ